MDGNSSDRAESRNGAVPASRSEATNSVHPPRPASAASRESSHALHRQDSSRSNSSSHDIPQPLPPTPHRHHADLLRGGAADPLLQLRDPLLHSPYAHPQNPLFPQSAAGLLAQRSAAGAPGYPDWRGADMAARLDFLRSEEVARQRELERHRDQMLSQHSAALALDKYRAELLMRDRLERERLVAMDREREIAERNKAAAVAAAMAHHPPHLRPGTTAVDSLYLPIFPPSAAAYSRPPTNHSPLLNSSSSSPASIPPPPLISSTPPSKPKAPSPLVNSTPTTSAISTALDKPATNGHDPDLTR